PAPPAELDRRGRQRPVHRRGRGRGAGTESSLGNGNHHQGDEEPGPVASSIRRCDARDAASMLAFRSVASALVTRQATFALLTISRNRWSWALRFRQAM